MTDQMPDREATAQHERDHLRGRLNAAHTGLKWQTEHLEQARRTIATQDKQLRRTRHLLDLNSRAVRILAPALDNLCARIHRDLHTDNEGSHLDLTAIPQGPRDVLTAIATYAEDQGQALDYPSVRAALTDDDGTPNPDLRTPDQWQQITGVHILDADGWTGRDAKDWDQPIDITEWERRAAISTISTRRDLGSPSRAQGVERSREIGRLTSRALDAERDRDEARAQWDRLAETLREVLSRWTLYGSHSVLQSAGIPRPAGLAAWRAVLSEADLSRTADALDPVGPDLSDVLRQRIAQADDTPADGPTVEQLLHNVRLSLTSARDDDDRAEAISMLLSGWYAAWPVTAVTDPHDPIAEELVRLLRPQPSQGQEIPRTLLTVLVHGLPKPTTRQSPFELDIIRDAARQAYRVGYAAALGHEITIGDLGDRLEIGDRPTADEATEAVVGHAHTTACVDERTP